MGSNATDAIVGRAFLPADSRDGIGALASKLLDLQVLAYFSQQFIRTAGIETASHSGRTD
jgi:hypothetical protein